MEVALRCATGWLLVPLIPDQDEGSSERSSVCSPGISFDLKYAARVYVDPVVLCLRSDLRLRSANGALKIQQKGDPPVGQVFGGGCGRRAGRFDTLCRRHVDYREVRRALPARHVSNQCQRCILDWNSDGPFDGALPAPPQLAALPSGRRAWRIHHFFKLRVRNLSGCPNRRALVGVNLHGRQRAARILRCLGGRISGRPSLVAGQRGKSKEVKC
jgi:hypothetical protein